MSRVDPVGMAIALVLFYVGQRLFFSHLIFWSLVGALLMAIAAVFLVNSISFDPPAGV